MRAARRWIAILLWSALGLCTTSCLRKAQFDGLISGTHEGSLAVNTLHDFEIAAATAQSGLGMLEALHQSAPRNEEAILMLTRAWGATSAAFIEDEFEKALVAGDTDAARYHNLRVQAGFRRARFFGVTLMHRRAAGFEEAGRNHATLQAWLERHFALADDAEVLLWFGFAWLGYIGAASDDPAQVAELYVGALLVERSVELHERLEHGLGHVIFGAYHARSTSAELDESRRHFERALEINGGRLLQTQLNYARWYHCMRGDRRSHDRLLREVLETSDPLPEARLSNVVAKRRARRYLEHRVLREKCGFVE